MRRRCSPQAVHGSRPQGQSRTTSRHAPRCSGSQRACGEEPARTKHTPRRADENAPFEKEVECNIAPVCRPAALRSTAESRPELQIRITQLVRERSPPPDLRLPPAKLSRKTNWVARGRIRQFESDMPSHAVVAEQHHELAASDETCHLIPPAGRLWPNDSTVDAHERRCL